MARKLKKNTKPKTKRTAPARPRVVAQPHAGERLVALMSGGLDSATLLWSLLSQDYFVDALFIDYGQLSGRRERQATRTVVGLAEERFPGQVHLTEVSVPSLRHLLSGSALTSPETVPMPEAELSPETQPLVYVANRNAILLSLAYGHATALAAHGVAIATYGIHCPDCDSAFLASFAKMERLALRGVLPGQPPMRLVAPFAKLEKWDIVRLGAKLGVPFEHTYTCFSEGPTPCGCCPVCIERADAFEEVGIPDPALAAIAAA